MSEGAKGKKKKKKDGEALHNDKSISVF